MLSDEVILERRNGPRRLSDSDDENLNVNVTHATPLFGINVSFMASTDLVNNCAKFEACSFSHCEDTAESPNMYNLEKMRRTFSRLSPRRLSDFCTVVAI